MSARRLSNGSFKKNTNDLRGMEGIALIPWTIFFGPLPAMLAVRGLPLLATGSSVSETLRRLAFPLVAGTEASGTFASRDGGAREDGFAEVARDVDPAAS